MRFVHLTPLMALAALACDPDTGVKSVDDDPVVTFLRPATGDSFNPLEPVELCAQIADEDVDGVL